MQEGDLCTFAAGDGTFRVAKVLKLEEGVVHVRVYANSFDEQPADVDTSVLTLGSVFEDENFGLGHVPLASKDFAAWQPELIRNDPVQPEELEGYEIWREAADEGSAGVWDWDSEKPKLRERIRRFLGRR
jgi:hypothetical protein